MELLIVVVALVGLMAVVRLSMPGIVPFFVFYPETLQPHETHPRYWGFPQATEVRIPTEDGIELHAWWFAADRPESRRGTAIYFHGNAGHLGDRGAVAAALSNLGLDVLLPDYRGYGASGGKPSEEGLYADARAAYRWLVEERGVDPAQLLALGNSLGSSVAAALAVSRPVAGVVLLGPFTDTVAIARHRLSWLPDWYLDWLDNRFDTLERAPRIEVPTFVAAGEEDRVIPPGQSREVFEALRGPRRWLEIPGAGHNDIFAHEALWRELQRFTRDVLTDATPGAPPER
ncbi:MAG: lysophospholipase [Gemmatimonadales bacterium]|nr:lysophospholipase [Gemmatimonadales bacterium]MYG48774.1 lysophospholipase [Gemmatimonadales bacterium]MYK03326.1 lysophospholipase [Candidatus Palauibacter ramosifaciens]